MWFGLGQLQRDCQGSQHHQQKQQSCQKYQECSKRERALFGIIDSIIINLGHQKESHPSLVMRDTVKVVNCIKGTVVLFMSDILRPCVLKQEPSRCKMAVEGQSGQPSVQIEGRNSLCAFLTEKLPLLTNSFSHEKWLLTLLTYFLF